MDTLFKVRIAGPEMLMHNSRLADPLDPYTKRMKAVTAKKKKSDEDHENIAEIEFQGGLWYDDDGDLGPIVPAEAIDAVVAAGATKNKLGKIFKACVAAVGDAYPLIYKGPRDRKSLWADAKFRDRRRAGIQQSSVIRTRPRFRDWSCEFQLRLTEGSSVNPESVKQALIDGGRYFGLGDYRPRFGLFQLQEFKF